MVPKQFGTFFIPNLHYMKNEQMADALQLLAALSDIHGENPFKAKSYAAAAFSVGKSITPISSLSQEQLLAQKGIGPSSAQKIQELITTGRIDALDTLIKKTPEGILSMMSIKGLGPKKIHAIWKEMEIETPGELLYACQENRLKRIKGFGEKTQTSIKQAIEFYLSNIGHLLYPTARYLADEIESILRQAFPGQQWQLTGEMRRQCQVIHRMDWITDLDPELFEKNVPELLARLHDDFKEPIREYRYHTGHVIRIYFSKKEVWGLDLLKSTGPNELIDQLSVDTGRHETEQAVFASNQLPFIPPVIREVNLDLASFKEQPTCSFIQLSDIRGIIHCHSDWSDGSQTIEELAEACINAGLEYLVISDHSQAAFYANGLSVERLLDQHRHIDRLNALYSPFRIFKSIESDILYDGRLDYPDDVLSLFDCVIASVHSHLKMTEDKAMERLLRAVENPHTTFLGHPTGRLLLSRPGYPVVMDTLIDACAKFDVVIELNANPNRLDIDWTYIKTCLSKKVPISINPDAHDIQGLQDIEFGVTAAQKALVQPQHNISSMGLDEITAFFENRKKRKRLG